MKKIGALDAGDVSYDRKGSGVTRSQGRRLITFVALHLAIFSSAHGADASTSQAGPTPPAQLVQPRYSSGGTNIIINGAGQAAGQPVSTVSSQVASQFLNQPPTMHTPAGYVLDVMVEHDLSLPAYMDHGE